MAALPYSLEPTPGYHAYKVTAMLRDYLALQLNEPGSQEKIDQILKLMDDYIVQLKTLGAQNHISTTTQVYEAIDGFFVNTPEEGKKEIKCKAGCTGCCYIDVDISELEAAVIIDHCLKNDIVIDKAYLAQQAAAGRKSYSALSRCVFLKDNFCTIYTVRPIACRKHWVMTDPQLCDFSKNITNQVGGFFNINTEIMASAMLNVSEVMPFEKALLHMLELKTTHRS